MTIKNANMKNKIAFALIMGILTTGIISFTIITVNVGFKPNFITLWLRSWVIAYVIAVPAILVAGPRVQLLVNNLFKEKG